MPAWELFFVAVSILLILIVALSRLSQRALQATNTGTAVIEQGPLGRDTGEPATVRPVSTGELYANVVASHGLFAAILIGLIWWLGIPRTPIGLDIPANVLVVLLLGSACGLGLYVANEVSVILLDRVGIAYSDELRAVLTPSSSRGWASLLVVVLPIIAGFEELLFRGVLVGALGAATGISAWLLAAGSSVLFAVGHGIQGQGGIIVTGLLGFVLAGLFLFTESLAVVIVAHYLVNMLEFTVNEALAWSLRDRSGA